MTEMENLISRICAELDKIAKQGLPTSGQGAEIVVRLITMLKDLENIKYWQRKGEYYDTALEAMRQELDGYSERGYSRDGDYSGRRRRDSRGRYSRDGYAMRGDYDGGNSYHGGRDMRDDDSYDRYMDEKHSFRSGNKSGSCKDRLARSASEYMEGFTQRLKDMLRDSDCQEEREAIMRCIDNIRSIK